MQNEYNHQYSNQNTENHYNEFYQYSYLNYYQCQMLMISILIYFNVIINSEYLNTYHTVNFLKLQNENNNESYLKNLKVKNAETLKHIDDHEINDENKVKENIITLKLNNFNEEIMTHFMTVKVMKFHIYKNC